MGGGHAVTLRQILFVSTRFDADVLLAQQSAGEDFQRAVFRKGITRVQGQRDQRLERLVIERDGLHPAHDHACTLDGRLRLEATDIVKLRRDFVVGLEIQVEQVGRLQGQKQHCRQPQEHKQTYPHIVFGALHARSPSMDEMGRRHARPLDCQMLNISAVRMKSSPSTASEATTTVRVVARETPSGVGCARYP